MKQFEMLQELMFEKLKNLEAEVEALKKRVQLLEGPECNKQKNEENKLQEEKAFTRSSARDRVIELIHLNVKDAIATVANRSEGSGIIVTFPEEVYNDPYKDYPDIEPEVSYRCKFYYSQTYDDNNPISWSTVNKDALHYDYFIFTMSISCDSADINCPDDIDGPNLYTFIFSKDDLEDLIKASNKDADKTGKYHFAFTIRIENGQEKAFQVRDQEVDVTNNLNNFGIFTRNQLPF